MRIVNGPNVTVRVVSAQTGAPLAGVTVTVNQTVYTDPEFTSPATAFTTDGGGGVSFYAPPGSYTFTTSSTAAAAIEPVEVLGPEEGTGLLQQLNAGKAQKLTRTAVKTANYTAAAGDLVPCDTTSAAFTVTLPTAPSVGSRVAVKLVTVGAGNAVTVACGGSDVFNKTGGSTTGTLTLLNQALQVQYDAGGIWTVVADDLPKSQLDGIYAPLLAPTTKSGNYTAAASDLVLVNATSGALTVTLPANVAGIVVGVKKTDATTNTVTVTPTAGTIDGAASDTITHPNTTVIYRGDGTNWYRQQGYRTLTAAVQETLETQRLTALTTHFAGLANRELAAETIMCWGDSLTEGMGATQHNRTYPARLHAALRGRFPTSGLSADPAVDYLSSWNASSTLPAPGTITGTPANGTQFGLGMKYEALTSGMSESFTVTGTTVKIHYARGAASGTFSWAVDGGGATNVSTISGSTTDTGVTTISLGAAGSHTVVIAWVSGGSIFFEGIEVFNGDESKGIRCLNAGHFGYVASSYTPNNTNITAMMGVYQPSLVILELGVNEMTNGVSSATFQTNLTSLLTAIESGCTIMPSTVLLAAWQRDASYSEPWSNYVAAMQNIANAATNRVLFNGPLHMPPVHSDTHSLYYDSIHATDKGYSMLADSLAGFLSPR